MPKVRTLQPSVTYGVVDRNVQFRHDTKFLEASLSDGENIIILPQGGFDDRGGIDDFGATRSRLQQTHTADVAGVSGNTSWPWSTNITSPSNTVSMVDLGNFYVENENNETGLLRLLYLEDGKYIEFGRCEISFITRNRRFTRRPGLSPIRSSSWRIEVSGFNETTQDIEIGTITFWKEISIPSKPVIKSFDHQSGARYQLAFSEGNIDIYKDGAWQAAVPFTVAENHLGGVWVNSKSDSIILTHETLAPTQLQRQGGDDQWQISEIDFSYVPIYDFGDVTYDNGVDEVQTFGFAEVDPNDVVEVSFAGIQLTDLVYQPDMTDAIDQLQTELRALAELDDGVNVSLLAGTSYQLQIEFTGPRSGSRSWPKISALNVNKGLASVTLRRTKGEPAGEDLFSKDRGYPRISIFLQERLIFFGLPSLPNAMIASGVGSPFNLNTELTNPTSAFFYEIDALDGPPIDIVSVAKADRLIIFGTNGVIYYENDTLDATEVPNFKGTDQPGIEKNTQPLRLDNRIVYTQVGGQTINIMNYTQLETGYSSENASVLSAEFIDRPISLAIRRSIRSVDSDVLFMVMETGNAVTYTLMRSQEVSGFAPQKTAGKFISVCSHINGDIWFCVEASTYAGRSYRLQKLNPEGYLDTATAIQNTEVASPSNLEQVTFDPIYWNKNIWIIDDDQPKGPFKVSSQGVIETDEKFIGEVLTVGIWDNTPSATDHAHRFEFETGAPVPEVMRVCRAEISVIDTTSVAISANDGDLTNVPLMFNDTSHLDLPALQNQFTGEVIAEGMPGFTKHGKMTISQVFPGRLKVRLKSKDIAA